MSAGKIGSAQEVFPTFLTALVITKSCLFSIPFPFSVTSAEPSRFRSFPAFVPAARYGVLFIPSTLETSSLTHHIIYKKLLSRIVNPRPGGLTLLQLPGDVIDLPVLDEHRAGLFEVKPHPIPDALFPGG